MDVSATVWQFTAGLNAHETLFNTKTCQVKNLKSNRETISRNCLADTGFRLQSDSWLVLVTRDFLPFIRKRSISSKSVPPLSLHFKVQTVSCTFTVHTDTHTHTYQYLSKTSAVVKLMLLLTVWRGL